MIETASEIPSESLLQHFLEAVYIFTRINKSIAELDSELGSNRDNVEQALNEG